MKDSLDRISAARKRLNELSDQAAIAFYNFEKNAIEAGAATEARVRLPEAGCGGYEICFVRAFEKNSKNKWQVAFFYDGHVVPHTGAPRPVKIAGASHLEDLAAALATEMESLVNMFERAP